MAKGAPSNRPWPPWIIDIFGQMGDDPPHLDTSYLPAAGSTLQRSC